MRRTCHSVSRTFLCFLAADRSGLRPHQKRCDSRERLAELPPSILILTGAKLRAAAVVSGGDLIDAVWLDSDDHARGETAGMALLGATKGSLAGYALDDPRVAEALTMLWRLPVAVSGVETLVARPRIDARGVPL